MKQLFFQLKTNITKNIKNIIKKPLFLEILIGAVFSFVIMVISVSGFEKQVYREDFDTAESTISEDDNIEVDVSDNDIDWGEINRGDALSEMQEDSNESTSTNTRITTPAPTYVLLLTTPSSDTQSSEAPITDDEEIVELPEVTFLPEVTSTPEPEVILDPNGPVIVSDMEEKRITSTYRESITITAYNPAGNKLSNEYINVVMNETTLYPDLTYNGSYTYILDYTYGLNKITVNVYDENSNSKEYEYLVYLDSLEKQSAIISVDAESIGLGYMINPTPVEIVEGKNVASYVKEILSQNGYSTFSKGSQNSNYEFRGLYRADLYAKCEPQISEDLLLHLNNNSMESALSDHYNNFVKNGYFLTSSKWIFEINGVRYFDSMSNYTLQNGDILKVRFSLNNGIDLDYLDNYFIPETTPEPTETIPTEQP